MTLLLAVSQQPGAAAISAPASDARVGGRLGVAFVYLFVIAMLLPISIMIGPLRLSPYRIVLIIGLVPICYALMTGAWRLRAPDYFVILYAAWPVVSIFWHHGVGEGVEPAGIHMIEVFGAYGLARCFIRSQRDLERVLRLFLFVLAALLPFAVYESLTHHLLLRELVGLVFDTYHGANRETRLGLQRVHGPFQHPILFGVFCASLFGLLLFAPYGSNAMAKRLVSALVVGTVTFLSLSSGPLVAWLVQIGMIGWYLALRYLPYKWWLAVGLAVAGYLIVDLLSNRTPVQVLISYATFNQANAYNRIHIWNFGIAEVLRHPIFGIGFNEWQNGWWMSQSMDNFWLLTAVRFGVPAFLFLALAIVLAVLHLGGLKRLTRAEDWIRTGWAVSLVGFVVAGGTVHLWNAVFSHFFFLLGAALWLLDRPTSPARAEVCPAERAVRGAAQATAVRSRRLLPMARSHVMSAGSSRGR